MVKEARTRVSNTLEFVDSQHFPNACEMVKPISARYFSPLEMHDDCARVAGLDRQVLVLILLSNDVMMIEQTWVSLWTQTRSSARWDGRMW